MVLGSVSLHPTYKKVELVRTEINGVGFRFTPPNLQESGTGANRNQWCWVPFHARPTYKKVELVRTEINGVGFRFTPPNLQESGTGANRNQWCWVPFHALPTRKWNWCEPKSMVLGSVSRAPYLQESGTGANRNQWCWVPFHASCPTYKKVELVRTEINGVGFRFTPPNLQEKEPPD